MPDPAFPVGELPPFIREALPQFRVTGHAYSACFVVAADQVCPRTARDENNSRICAAGLLEPFEDDGPIFSGHPNVCTAPDAQFLHIACVYEAHGSVVEVFL